MFSDIFQNKNLEENILNYSNKVSDCKASKASTEIMLDRVCNGQEIVFPFLK